MIKIILKPFLFIIYTCLYLVPRTKKIWVFGSGSGHSFSDNAKYLFLYSIQQKDVKCYWISKDKNLVEDLRQKGYPTCYAYSLKGVYLCIFSRVYIYDGRASGINFWTSLGAYHVNLWHGAPLKKLDRDVQLKTSVFYLGHHGNYFKKLSIKYQTPEWFIIPDLMIATSEKVELYLKSAFGTDHVVSVGYPRNDIIVNSILYNDEEPIVKSKYDKIILYTPTFRDSNTENREILVDWTVLNNLMIEQNAMFWVKLHRHDNSLAIKQAYSHIKVLENDIDVYPMFKKIDLLITDYSSIFFDFLLTNKPILFYPYDKESYLNNDRPLYDDYDTVTPGFKVYNFQEFLIKLKLFFNDSETLNDNQFNYNSIKNMYHKRTDSGGAERTFNYIEDSLLNLK